MARSPLADPSWGLAWSNPDGISTSALIQNALLKGGYALILEACKAHGLGRVQADWRTLCESGEPRVPPWLIEEVGRQIRNIGIGLAKAKEETNGQR